MRNWPIISADYRLMLSCRRLGLGLTGQDILDDVISAYSFVQTKLQDLLELEQDKSQKIDIILMGLSAGLCLCPTDLPYIAFSPDKLYIQVHIYHFLPNHISHLLPLQSLLTTAALPFLIPITISPATKHYIARHLTTNPSSPISSPVHRSSIPLLSWSSNPPHLYSQIALAIPRSSQYPKRSLKIAPQYSFGYFKKINYLKCGRAQLFTAIGKIHAWDIPLYLGDLGLKQVGEVWRAWRVLDEIIAVAQAASLAWEVYLESIWNGVEQRLMLTIITGNLNGKQ